MRDDLEPIALEPDDVPQRTSESSGFSRAERRVLIGAAVIASVSFAVTAYHEKRQADMFERQECRSMAMEFYNYQGQDPDPRARDEAIRRGLEACDGRERPVLPTRTTVPDDPER